MFYFVRFMKKVLLLSAQNSDMSHFSPRLGLFLAVDMNKGIINFHNFFEALIFHITITTLGPYYIHHNGRENGIGIAERISKH